MDKATIRALRNLLLIIYDEQKSDWSSETQTGRKPSSKAKELYEKYYYNKWHPVEETELEGWLNESDGKLEIDFSERKAVLYLPPLEKNAEFVPVLSLKCKIGEMINSMSLYVLLIRSGKDSQKPYGIGFRFESPESEHFEKSPGEEQPETGEGLHDFYHAQLITGFDYGPEIEIPDWLPTSQPSFPLLAYDPVTLVFALLMTLYGKKYCWDFYNKHATNLRDLNPRIKRLQPWIKWKAIITFDCKRFN